MKITKLDYSRLVGVDHFYLGFSREELKDLKALAKFPFCRYSKVKSGKDSWQGVYWSAAQGHYFEMVETPQPGHYQFGLAMSANQIQYFDVRRIKELFKGAKSLTSLTRRIGGVRWFEAVSSGALEGSPAFLWAMHYFFCPRDRKVSNRDEPSVVERFSELEIRANPNFLKALRESGYWAPFRSKRSGNTTVLEFRHKDRSTFKVRVKIDSNVKFTTFVSLKGQASPFQKPLPAMKHFKLARKRGVLILSRK